MNRNQINHFSVCFYTRKSKSKSKEKLKIYARITFAGVRKELSVHLSVAPELWDSVKSRAKGSLLTLLVIGILNSCKKDDGGGSDDSTDNSDTTQPNYTVAAVNIPLEDFSYTLTKESNNLEGFTGKESEYDFAGEITFDSKGSPSEFYILNGLQVDFKTEDKLITEIIDPEYPGNDIISNFKLISKNNNTYTYGMERDYGDDGVGVVDGCIIRIIPKFDSISIIMFDRYNDEIDYEDSFGLNYRKSCKTSFSINALNLISSVNSEFTLPLFCIANILDNMDATFFTMDMDGDGQHKNYNVTFNDKKLPVRVDGIVNRRIWTATYQ